MKQSKKNDCVALKNKIQKALNLQYEGISDTERATLIEQKLMSSDSPIALFWQKIVGLSVSDEKAKYKRKND
ncbi:MAG: hypothetical protein ACE5HX_13560 [bacterium]